MMTNYFTAGREFVRWELTALAQSGPYRLAIHHARGSIVEYFKSSDAALVRERELEALLRAASANDESLLAATSLTTA